MEILEPRRDRFPTGASSPRQPDYPRRIAQTATATGVGSTSLSRPAPQPRDCTLTGAGPGDIGDVDHGSPLYATDGSLQDSPGDIGWPTLGAEVQRVRATGTSRPDQTDTS